MNFNPRSHKGSDRSCGERGQPDIYFNPRSHKGSDPVAWMPLPVPYIFQSTLPQGERLPFLRLEGSQTNFNPRSHKGSDDMSYNLCKYSWTFQSTLPQGERQLYSAYILSNILYFNPRSHKGSDRAGDGIIQVSIYFNPRSHKGSDEASSFLKGKNNRFQSTLPQGERRA